MRNRPLLINLWAAPGVGKSTTRAALFNMMKHLGHNVEEVTEFAKDLTYEGRDTALRDQMFVTASQEFKCFRLIGKVDYIITDSPVGLGLVYGSDDDVPAIAFMIGNARKRYDNFDVVLERDHKRPYKQYGRSQTLEESRALEQAIEDTCYTLSDDDYLSVTADIEAPHKIYKWVMENGGTN